MQNSHPSYARRGHAPQISISDDNHHVTEAIGGMYGSDDDEYLTPSRRASRPLSFIGGAAEAYDTSAYFDTKRSSPPRTPLQQTVPNEKLPLADSLSRKGSIGSENLPMSPSSPPSLSRKASSSSAETAVQQFPLNDIDYESSPAAVAQELFNLQAIRRMSMNVDNADPDLPSFSSPVTPPPDDAEEDKASGLFWVPARLHPELAPKEFKTFVEDRVDLIRKRSVSGDSLLSGVDRSNSGGLGRKKSMLSRQIDSSKGYQDGAERLQRKRSEGSRAGDTSPTVGDLQELEGLVSNVGVGSNRSSLDLNDQDAPLPPPPGPTLKRSTRTFMRKDRPAGSRRGLNNRHSEARQSESDSEQPRAPIVTVSAPEESSPYTNQVKPEPEDIQATPPHQAPVQPTSISLDNSKDQHKAQPQDPHTRTTFHSRIASNGRTTAPIPGYNSPMEAPPSQPQTNNSFTIPERKSSHTPHNPASNTSPSQPPPHKSSASHQNNAPPRNAATSRGARSRPLVTAQSISRQTKSTLDDISSHPSPLPGSGGTRTDALTMVPTFEDKKVEKKDSRKTSWNWLLGGEEKDREKEREKERKSEEKEREKEAARKSRMGVKHHAKPTDKTRLDVLQASIDGNSSVPKGRESLVLDRESIKLDEERKKDGSRRSTDGKKDKDSGILSAIFGGAKRSKGHHHQVSRDSPRALSPEPPPRILRPDIDYNWTRFSILEERAIYRMAHMKLANPRRPLHSQVLLSNFMYSYLAKVQMYHPQAQIPAAQKTAQARQQQQAQQQQQSGNADDDQPGQEYNKYKKWQEQRQHQASDASGGPEQQQLQSQQQQEQQQLQQQQLQQHQQQQQRAAGGGGSQGSAGQDYLGYSNDSSPFDQSSLWQDEENTDLW